MSTSTNPSRVPAGVTTGGQFATSARGESDASIGTGKPGPIRVDVNAKASIDAMYEVLPEYPFSLGDPQMSYQRDLEGGDLTLTVTTDFGGTVSFWEDGNTLEIGEYEGPELSTKQRDMLIAWGTQVRKNVDVAHARLEDQILPAFEQDILAIATAHDPQAERAATKDDGGNVEAGVQKAAAVMGAWVDDVDTEPESATKDALTDLIHFARSRGLDPHDIFEAAMHRADVERDEDADHRAYLTEASEA
jgi:hypothetical protein